MQLIIKKLSDSKKSGFAVVSRKIGAVTIDVAAGYVKVDEGTEIGHTEELSNEFKVTQEERVSDNGTCTWLRIEA